MVKPTRTYNVNGELVAFVDVEDRNKNRYVAFRNEALFNLGRRPTLVERQVIWKDVQHLYPDLPSGPVPFGGQR